MKKGDLVRNDLGWLGRVEGISKHVRLRWETGKLKGREALVPKEFLRVVG